MYALCTGYVTLHVYTYLLPIDHLLPINSAVREVQQLIYALCIGCVHIRDPGCCKTCRPHISIEK